MAAAMETELKQQVDNQREKITVVAILIQESVSMKELAIELGEIYDHLKANLPADAPSLIIELDQCNVWLARSSQLLADAQFYRDQKRGEYAESQANLTVELRLSATLFREMIGMYSAEEEALVTQADRLNKTLGLRIESIRTIISFEKQLARN